jgi:hypothetical protein
VSGCAQDWQHDQRSSADPYAGLSPDATEERQIRGQLRAVEERLLAQYRGHASVTEEQVRATMTAAVGRFTDARIRTFIPILVERAARAELPAD